MKVPVDKIIVKNRIRKDLGDLNALAESIRKHGLMNNIIINHNYELIAGHRRLEAVKKLGWNTVAVTFMNNLTDIEKLEIEIQENLQRKDFTSEEMEEAHRKLDKLKNPGMLDKIKNFLKKIFSFLFKHKKT